MKDKLRIGVALDQSDIPDWKNTLLQKIVTEKLGSLEVFLFSPFRKVEEGARLWEKHMELDAKYFKPQPDAFRKIAVEDAFENVSCLDWNDRKIEDHYLDVVIWLNDEPIPETIYDHLTMGVFYFFNGDRKETSEAFLGYWEFMKFKGVITSTLLFQKKASSPIKLVKRTWSMMSTLSIARGRNEHMWKLPSLMLRTLKEIQKTGAIEFYKEIGQKDNFEISKIGEDESDVSFLSAALNMGDHFFRMFVKLLKKITHREQWILMIHDGQSASTDFQNFKKILPPKDRFWADPFLIEKNEKQYLFIEELPFATDKGHLSVIEIKEDGSLSDPVVILDKPYHLSYPFIFESDEKYYMIPESYEDKSIQVYECTSFPFEWKHKMNLMSDLSAFDTTLYFYNEKWWMFTLITEQKGGGHNDELFLFFADTPLTKEWNSHPQNPIVSDVRSARPAGNVYEENGKLIRPSQDCGRKYGYGFNLNEIEVMTETEYREKRILKVLPDWDKSLSRTHSFNHLPGLTVIDAVVQRSRFF